MSLKVVSFSLWGTYARYTIGAIKNAELVNKYYPGFVSWFYIHKESVPDNIVKSLEAIPNVKIIFKTGNIMTCKPMMWRFEAIDDPEVAIVMPRDTDTRILMREVDAVNIWLESGKTFHIMRDHPDHVEHILGGMFGTRKIPSIPQWGLLMEKVNQNNKIYNYDQAFLRDYIYPAIKNDAIIHASFNKRNDEACLEFPSKYIDYHHVGEYVYPDESRNGPSVNEIKNKCPPHLIAT